jgi:hypothetical protein
LFLLKDFYSCKNINVVLRLKRVEVVFHLKKLTSSSIVKKNEVVLLYIHNGHFKKQAQICAEGCEGGNP